MTRITRAVRGARLAALWVSCRADRGFRFSEGSRVVYSPADTI